VSLDALGQAARGFAQAWREMPWSERAEAISVFGSVLALISIEAAAEHVARAAKYGRTKLIGWRCREGGTP